MVLILAAIGNCAGGMRMREVRMIKTYDQMVKDILAELPSESDYLDYKQQPYAEKGKLFEDGKKRELLKDIIAMANVQQVPNDYRFIIVGVSNDRKCIGVDALRCCDDSSYQGLFAKIEPRLSVNTGVVTFRGKAYEYFCIKPEAHTVYAVKEKCNFDSAEILRQVAFVRRGSTTGELADSEILRIKSSALSEAAVAKTEKDRLLQARKIMAVAALIGAWDEKKPGDCEVISQIAEMPYKEWARVLHNELHSADSIFFQDGKWKIANRISFLEKYGDGFFDEDMAVLKAAAIRVLTTADPKYHAAPEERWMRSEETGHSAEITRGLSQMVAIVRYHKELFSNCSNRFEVAFVSSILDAALGTEDWRVLATLDKNIQFLAEADPQAFLRLMKECVDEGDSAWWHFFSEEEPAWGSEPYGSGCFRALKLLAIAENYFSEACVILFKIAMKRKDVLKVLKEILLPWYPETGANAKKRRKIFRKLSRLDTELSWELLYQLLPVHLPGAVCPIQYPLYLPFKEIPRPDKKEYLEVCNSYESEAVTLAEGDTHKIARLIDVSMRLYKEPFMQLVRLLENEQKKKYDEKARYFIWNCILSYTCQLKRHGGEFSERCKVLGEVADQWRPEGVYWQAKRVFDESLYAVIEEKSDIATEIEELKHVRKEWLEKLYQRDGKHCVAMLSTVAEYAAGIGAAVAKLPAMTSYADEHLSEWLSTKDGKYLELAKGYIWERQMADSDGVLSLLRQDWSDEAKLNFMTALPLKREYWEMAKRTLSVVSFAEYWKNQRFDVDLLVSGEEASYVVQHFLYCKQWKKALLLAGVSIDKEIACSKETVEKVLLYPHIQEFHDSNSCSYLVKKLFQYLVDDGSEKSILFPVAWRWYDLLEDKATILFDSIASDPHFFMMLLVILYNPDRSKEFGFEQVTTQMQQKCLAVLADWKTVPGMHGGKLEPRIFRNWMEEVDKEKERYSVMDLADSYVGKILFHSIDWHGNSFLPGDIADFLEDDNRSEVREGFFFAAIHSPGIHIIDAEGSVERNLANRYGEKAGKMDDEGYVEVAAMLRRIQSYFMESADEIVCRFQDRQFVQRVNA